MFDIHGVRVNAMFDAFNDDGPELNVCRREHNAVVMAVAVVVARLAGVLGVVLVTSRPGTATSRRD